MIGYVNAFYLMADGGAGSAAGLAAAWSAAGATIGRDCGPCRAARGGAQTRLRDAVLRVRFVGARSRLLANERRLLVLCHLVAEGEMTVSALAKAVGVSQPALSQHLADCARTGW